MDDFRKFAADAVALAASLNAHTDADWSVLAEVRATTRTWSAEVGRAYGEAIYGNPRTAAMMESHSRGDRELGFSSWYERLVSGAPGDAFWAETALVGFMLAAGNVDSGLLAALGGRIEGLVMEKCLVAFPGPKAVEVFSAFKRIFAVAQSVIVSSYEHAIMLGVSQVGLNERLVQRMRTSGIKKMVETHRQSLPLMEWSDALSVGVSTIDEQHRKLVGLLNQLHVSSVSGKGNDTMRSILAELTDYTATHFAFEEDLFRKFDYPDYLPHKDAHEKLVAQVVQFNGDFQAGRASMSADLFMFLRRWLSGHIVGTDRKYAPFFHAHGVR